MDIHAALSRPGPGPTGVDGVLRGLDVVLADRTMARYDADGHFGDPHRRRGDTTAADTLVRRFADEFRGRGWPGAVRPKVCYDPRSVETDGPGGARHAKAVVAAALSGLDGRARSRASRSAH